VVETVGQEAQHRRRAGRLNLLAPNMPVLTLLVVDADVPRTRFCGLPLPSIAPRPARCGPVNSVLPLRERDECVRLCE
jgi:hypothetical protein